MKITKIGSDYISVNEENMKDDILMSIPRVHIIKLDFKSPNNEIINELMSLFSKTNRFVVDRFIRIYNDILKNTKKKFYVENTPGQPLISFFRKNNKILLNVNNLSANERSFILDEKIFADILYNTEVIRIDKDIFDRYQNVLQNWRGNVIIDE
jgi:hypothetical protein